MENLQLEKEPKTVITKRYHSTNLKRKVFTILESNNHRDGMSRFLNSFLVTLIIVNILAVILETVESIHKEYENFFNILELISVCIFTIEYLFRLWVCDYIFVFRRKRFSRLSYMLSPMAIVDLLAILPFLLSIFTAIDLRYISALRLVRLLRIFKLSRYSLAVKTLGKAIADKQAELVITFLSIIVLLVIASSLMYLIENQAQPHVFSSIPATMWWGIATLSTVGYGDIYPITPLGKILGGVIAVLGIGMFALPAGLISSSFTEQLQRVRKRPKCPHCGKTIVKFQNDPEDHEH
ncbi:MAG: ion transporter [Cytophagaceae bacterium]